MPKKDHTVRALEELSSAVGDMLKLVAALMLNEVSEKETAERISPIRDALLEAKAAIRAIDLTKPVEN